MTSEPTRDPGDRPAAHAADSALVVTDYQPRRRLRCAVEAIGAQEAHRDTAVDRGMRRLPSPHRIRAGHPMFPTPMPWATPLRRRTGQDSRACELQRDWARTDTVAEVIDIVLTSRLLNGI